MTNQIKKNETIIKNFKELDKLLSLFKDNKILTSELNVVANLTKLDNFLYQIYNKIYNKNFQIEITNENLKKEILGITVETILEELNSIVDLINEFFIKACGNKDYLVTHFEENFNFSDKISTLDNISKLGDFLEEFYNDSELFLNENDDEQETLDNIEYIRGDIEIMYKRIRSIHILMLKVITLINELRNLQDQK
ncbi:hypothetical protein [Candidatus Phytoplasma sp. AldY-WA1]|uniref:hypothetical protein n=1 Tax=Candidatus Phytoplasma sp. AldY-WA1 TaxID=2852100 RepID=UPI00254D254F|nr:hypothetical protein [Candidatus Phytoplasma sp. AldY-WA1]